MRRYSGARSRGRVFNGLKPVVRIGPAIARVAAIPAEGAGVEANKVAVVELLFRFYAARPFALS
jgi:hypothetical protein